jgi:cyclase
MRSFLVTLALVSAATAQDRDFSKVEIKATHVAGSVWMLEGAGGNIAATVGDDGIALVDDQFAPLVPKIRAALAKQSPKPIRFVINTHWHFDHTGSNALMAETAAILAHENVRKRLASGGTVFGRKNEPAPPPALPVVTFAEGLTLHWNGEDIRVVHVHPGHTDGDSVVFFAKANVVHLGDDYVTIGFPIIDRDSGGSFRGLIAALDEVIPRLPEGAKIIPGHGPLSTVDDVKRWRATLADILAAVEKARQSGKKVDVSVLDPWAPTLGQGFVKAADLLETILQESKGPR